MSTFLGLIEEIPGISIDRFDRHNMNSSAFFLSHCHSDHMEGLNYDFFNYLKTKNSFLYCSPISKLILETKFHQLDPYFVQTYLIELKIEEPAILNYVYCGAQLSITVTCIPSGHCPGSVMFLLNFKDKQILYTGDFRISIEDIPKLKSLHHVSSSQRLPLKINKIYLDTTFLNLDFKIFPSRIDSFKKLAAVVKEWLDKNPKNIVILEISALYGSEFLFIELSKILNKRIHVKDIVYNVYKKLEILVNHVTNDPESTSIHACMNKPIGKNVKNNLGLQCRTDIAQNNILTIIPSVQKWAGKDTSCIIEQDSTREQTINVCYSTHGSYREIEAFIKYFKPSEVFACVDRSDNEINDLLKNILQSNNHNEVFANKEKLIFSNYKASGTVKKFKPSLLSDDDDDDDN